MRILYVENHETFAQLVRARFLAAHDVKIVASLAAARIELDSTNWEVLLLDYDLDDGKGEQLVQELQSRSKRPLIVAVSAYDHNNEAMRAAGADATCGKLQFSQIEQVLHSLFN